MKGLNPVNAMDVREYNTQLPQPSSGTETESDYQVGNVR